MENDIFVMHKMSSMLFNVVLQFAFFQLSFFFIRASLLLLLKTKRESSVHNFYPFIYNNMKSFFSLKADLRIKTFSKRYKINTKWRNSCVKKKHIYLRKLTCLPCFIFIAHSIHFMERRYIAVDNMLFPN